MMRIIELADGSEWSCDGRGQGLFHRRSDGTWCQHEGTGDTPTFTGPQSFSRWLHKRYRERGGERLARMVGSRGWAVTS
jgi:hypothetical protein